MAPPSIYQQVLDPAHRANPYPLYAELRKTPVSREDDGTYVVSTYNEIFALLHDPRVSSDPRSHPGTASAAAGPDQGQPGLPLPFISRDPPAHDRLRELAMRPFGPPCTPGRIDGMRPWLAEITTGLIDKLAGSNRADIVDDFAYPLPVTAICQLLGVPLDDQPRFHQWADALIATIDPTTGTIEQRNRKRDEVNAELGEYFGHLVDSRARQPGDDLISGLLTDHGPHGPMSREDVLATANLLLVAGHETTVNLITNGMLTLLRHPGVLDRLNHEPGLVITLVEELLRYEPPVQMRTNRATVADIDIAGTTIPKGSPLALILAAGNRDPSRFADPDRFDPGRTDNAHFGFFGGIHYCFGAPLARTETQVALPELARRLVNPRLVADPPPYRPNPELRGPRHLIVEYDAVAPARQQARQAVSPADSRLTARRDPGAWQARRSPTAQSARSSGGRTTACPIRRRLPSFHDLADYPSDEPGQDHRTCTHGADHTNKEGQVQYPVTIQPALVRRHTGACRPPVATGASDRPRFVFPRGTAEWRPRPGRTAGLPVGYWTVCPGLTRRLAGVLVMM